MSGRSENKDLAFNEGSSRGAEMESEKGVDNLEKEIFPTLWKSWLKYENIFVRVPIQSRDKPSSLVSNNMQV